MSSDESLTQTDYSRSVMRAHASNNYAVFYSGRGGGGGQGGWLGLRK